jgi:UDP-N-acetylglucosamine:LPS N-acetylglucosamine transferase
MMIKDTDVQSSLLKKMKTLLHDAAMQEVMSKSLAAMAITDADERIARKVMEIAV